ncbi:MULTISPECIES: alpha/beta fold hydrolase [unclassified Streptomyces]|uniref:alpha/beta fold hydrolase n=1 Tax=unclassified Streptomyces TaxID=2593676 RepID=UPI00224FF58D|nr:MULTISPECIES: alpha/beta fold hydrolase [unclassified Streptomyces]MCX4989644.1 alpha/beta hydrolase [Streptomyces sp. NBC_00568]MCX5005116.1 alpha/beta hydrolase [Streptomyces sp. NBC_00638]
MTDTEFRTRTVFPRPDLPLALTETGPADGRVALVLHGGGGPATVQGIAAHLAARGMRAVVPTHPGWNGTGRPGWLTGVDDLAIAYLHWLRDEGHRDVLVVGSSLGGWTGAEMAFRDDGTVIGSLVLVNAAGVAVPGEPVRDIFALRPDEIATYSFHDPARFAVDPATLTEERIAAQRADLATLRVLAGDPYMHDPKLLNRLGRVRIPVLVLWGESDRIVTPAYGRAYAEAFARGRFEPIAEAGHLPHIERPEATFAALDAHLDARAHA